MSKTPFSCKMDVVENFITVENEEKKWNITDQVIVEYINNLRVVFWLEHEDYPQVWYHGQVLEGDIKHLVDQARDDLSYGNVKGKVISYGYKHLLIIYPYYSNNEIVEAFTKTICPSINTEVEDTEVEDILNGRDTLTVTFAPYTRVELRRDGPIFITMYGPCDDKVVIGFAMEMFRDPHTNWIDGDCECDNDTFSDFAMDASSELKKQILKEFANKSVKITFNSNISVHLHTSGQHLYYRKTLDCDFDVLIYKAIALLPTLPAPIDGVIVPEKLDDETEKLVSTLDSQHLSTGEYKIIGDKLGVLGYLGTQRDYTFSFNNPFLTVNFRGWVNRRDFERHHRENIELVYKDIVYDGTVVVAPRKSESLRVYFTEFKRYYYFFMQQRGEQLTIRISGVPDHRRHVIAAYIQGNDIIVSSFFFGESAQKEKPTIISVDFPGMGPRGMFLVKYIAQRLGATDAYLTDDWAIGKGDTKMESGQFVFLKENATEDDDDDLSREYDWLAAHRKKIKNWTQFHKEKGTARLAIENGYYGGFGFEQSEDPPSPRLDKHAKVDSIACASYMRGE